MWRDKFNSDNVIIIEGKKWMMIMAYIYSTVCLKYLLDKLLILKKQNDKGALVFVVGKMSKKTSKLLLMKNF